MTYRDAWEQVLGRTLPHPSHGNPNVATLCFCHDDTHESLSIDLERGLWCCHASGNGGTLADAVRIIRGVPASEAKAYVRQIGISPGPNKGRRSRHPDPTPIDARVRDSYVRALEADAERKAFATEKFGWAPETLRRYGIGWWASQERGRYTIPIRDEEGLICNIRLYDPFAEGMNKTISWKKGYGRARLFQIDSLQAQTIFIAEGEKDCILLNQQIRRFAPDTEWAAITGTGGAGTWNDEWSSLFYDKDVVLVYDIDDRGRSEAKKVAARLVPFARSVKVVTLDIDAPPDADVTDYFVTSGKSWDDFVTLLDATEAFDPTHDYPILDFGLWAAPEPEPDVSGASVSPAATSAAPPVQPDAPEKSAGLAESEISVGVAEPGDTGSSSLPARGFDGWDPPLPLRASSHLPAFPTAAFSSWLRDYVEGVAEETQTPRDLPAMVVLAVLATALAKKVEVHVR
ncbi:MAG: hypothetical protein H0U82_09520 [Actinobacteria bacterium]|nr:hypothetical protein [Actinomycetota bacterium]